MLSFPYGFRKHGWYWNPIYNVPLYLYMWCHCFSITLKYETKIFQVWPMGAKASWISFSFLYSSINRVVLIIDLSKRILGFVLLLLRTFLAKEHFHPPLCKCSVTTLVPSGHCSVKLGSLKNKHGDAQAHNQSDSCDSHKVTRRR